MGGPSGSPCANMDCEMQLRRLTHCAIFQVAPHSLSLQPIPHLPFMSVPRARHEPSVKLCTGRNGCFQLRPITDFHRRWRNFKWKRQGTCRLCMAARIKRWRDEHGYNKQVQKARTKVLAHRALSVNKDDPRYVKHFARKSRRSGGRSR